MFWSNQNAKTVLAFGHDKAHKYTYCRYSMSRRHPTSNYSRWIDITGIRFRGMMQSLPRKRKTITSHTPIFIRLHACTFNNPARSVTLCIHVSVPCRDTKDSNCFGPYQCVTAIVVYKTYYSTWLSCICSLSETSDLFLWNPSYLTQELLHPIINLCASSTTTRPIFLLLFSHLSSSQLSIFSQHGSTYCSPHMYFGFSYSCSRNASHYEWWKVFYRCSLQQGQYNPNQGAWIETRSFDRQTRPFVSFAMHRSLRSSLWIGWRNIQ